MKRILVITLICAGIASIPGAAKKKSKEEITQTLSVPRDPPPAISAQTKRLVFHTSALSGKGLLTQQTRDAVRDILRQNGGMQIVKVRAFVAGTGDLRRVPQIVSETFGERKHLLIPAVSVFQVGALPAEGAQVVLESISESKRDVNPQGLYFVAAEDRSKEGALQPIARFAEEALAGLSGKLAGRAEVLRVTCMASSLEDSAAMQAAMTARFPSAATDLVQARRASPRSGVACDAVARAVGSVPVSDTAITRIVSDRAILSGTQIAYGFTDEDARLAFRRLDRALVTFGASLKTAAVLDCYPLSASISGQVARLETEFVDKREPPAVSIWRLEGLPGMDASFAIEAVSPGSGQAASSQAELSQ